MNRYNGSLLGHLDKRGTIEDENEQLFDICVKKRGYIILRYTSNPVCYAIFLSCLTGTQAVIKPITDTINVTAITSMSSTLTG